MARTILRRLRFPKDVIEDVALLVRHHMRLPGVGELSDTAARRLMRDLGAQTEPLVRLCEADAKALKKDVRRPDFDEIRAVLHRAAQQTPPDRLKSPLTGEQIMELTGLGPGPDVGKVKRHLSDLVVEGALDPDDIESAERKAIEFAGNRTPDKDV